MTRGELFAKVRLIEAEVMAIISDDSKQQRFDELMKEMEKLKLIAKNQGWIP